MNFFSRLQGSFFSPQNTFKAISEKPVWVDALIILLIASALFSYIIAPYAQKDTLKAFENNVKLKERLGEQRFNQMIERMRTPSKTGILVRSLLLSPVSLLLGLLLSSLIILVLGRISSTEGKYIQVFSAFLHANFIDKILGSALRLFLILSRQSVMQTTTSLAIFFPQLEVTSPTFVILSQFDFFQLWMFGIFGFALAHIFKTDVKKAMILSYVFWLLKSLLYVALGMLSLRFMR